MGQVASHSMGHHITSHHTWKSVTGFHKVRGFIVATAPDGGASERFSGQVPWSVKIHSTVYTGNHAGFSCQEIRNNSKTEKVSTVVGDWA